MKANDETKIKRRRRDISNNKSMPGQRENRGKTKDKKGPRRNRIRGRDRRTVCVLDHKQEMYGLFVIVVTDGRGSRCSNIIFFFEKEIKIRLPADRER